MAIAQEGFTHNGVANAAQTATDYKFITYSVDALEVDDAGAGAVTIGIRKSNPSAAGVGVEYWPIGQVAKLTLGTGGATIGAYLKSDAAGAGVITTTDKDWVGAIALEAGDAAQVISVLVTGFTLSI